MAKLPLTLMGAIHHWKITTRMKVSNFQTNCRGGLNTELISLFPHPDKTLLTAPPLRGDQANSDFQHCLWSTNSQAGDLFHCSVFIDLQNSLNLQPLCCVLKIYLGSFLIPKFIKPTMLKKANVWYFYCCFSGENYTSHQKSSLREQSWLQLLIV